MSFPCYRAINRPPMSTEKSPNSLPWHAKSSKIWAKFTLPASSLILHCPVPPNWISHSSPEMPQILPWLCLALPQMSLLLTAMRTRARFLSCTALPHRTPSALILHPGVSAFHLVRIFGFASLLLCCTTNFIYSADPLLDTSLSPVPNTVCCAWRAFGIFVIAENKSEM